MQPEAGSPVDWLRLARSDLALARVLPQGEILRETLCFHAQQAVEKSLKAVLIDLRVAFPKTHSIERLIDLLPDQIPRTPWLMETATLTTYATAFRYPGEEDPLTELEYKEALRLAEVAVSWAEHQISRK
ncbi:MAG TPA: HEPN domain-containing protein [Terriglobia bacterium]|nr:HEPN domain-containing protein [Terriglobia bacterium]